MNLPALRQGIDDSKDVPLLRRRSGGGTVFHDRQNLNYCVIWPSSVLDRMKHAKMVTRAIREFNSRARLNERHDIVLDQGSQQAVFTGGTTEEVSGFELDGEALTKYPPLKVSGSAFRQTRGRAMHHGTCLVCSNNLKHIGTFLRSPGKAFIKAGGAESVRSPVGNVLDPEKAELNSMEDLSMGIIAEFQTMYDLKEDIVSHAQKQKDSEAIWVGDGCVYGRLNQFDDDNIQKGVEELKSYDWIWGKTGQISQFIISSHPEHKAGKDRQPLPDAWPSGLTISFAGRYGTIVNGSMEVSGPGHLEVSKILQRLEGRAINDIPNFATELRHVDAKNRHDLTVIGRWLDQVFGK